MKNQNEFNTEITRLLGELTKKVAALQKQVNEIEHEKNSLQMRIIDLEVVNGLK